MAVDESPSQEQEDEGEVDEATRDYQEAQAALIKSQDALTVTSRKLKHVTLVCCFTKKQWKGAPTEVRALHTRRRQPGPRRPTVKIPPQRSNRNILVAVCLKHGHWHADVHEKGNTVCKGPPAGRSLLPTLVADKSKGLATSSANRRSYSRECFDGASGRRCV